MILETPLCIGNLKVPTLPAQLYKNAYFNIRKATLQVFLVRAPSKPAKDY